MLRTAQMGGGPMMTPSDPSTRKRRIRSRLGVCHLINNKTDDVQFNLMLYNMYFVLRANKNLLTGGSCKEMLERLTKMDATGQLIDPGVLDELEGLARFDANGLPLDDSQDNLEATRDVISRAMKASHAFHSNNNASTTDRPRSPLQGPFSLLSPLNVDAASVDSRQLSALCERALLNPFNYGLTSEAEIEPRLPSPSAAPSTLNPKAPMVLVNTAAEAHNPALRGFCMDNSLVLIRGLVQALGIDVSKFTTKTIMDLAGQQTTDLRRQPASDWKPKSRMSGEWKQPWYFPSFVAAATVSDYADYAAQSFIRAVEDALKVLRARDAAETAGKLNGARVSTELNEIIKTEIKEPLRSEAEEWPNGSMEYCDDGPVDCDLSAASCGDFEAESKPEMLAPSPMVRSSEHEVKRRRHRAPYSHGHSHSADYIYFGTNVDLSGDLFKKQFDELQKLPSFCRVEDDQNFLKYLPFDVKGMNTAQFYIKIPGCKTPAHLENNSFCSVNLNIGPGDCEWYGVPYDYYPKVKEICDAQNLSFLDSSWWPNLDDLREAGIPAFHFVQKVNDVVFVNGGCIHWVSARGWCNNVAWNTGPACVEQLMMSIMAAEFNKAQRFVSLIPMQFLTWELAKNMPVADAKLYAQMRDVLVRSLARVELIYKYIENRLTGRKIEIISDPRECDNAYCATCKTELFNIFFAQLEAAEGVENRYVTYCFNCAEERKFESLEIWQTGALADLRTTLDSFKLAQTPS